MREGTQGSSTRIHRLLLFPGMLALVAGIWAGLLRLGWGLPPLRPLLPLAHGPLMVAGFLGTLIGLERAVALVSLGLSGRRGGLLGKWPYLAPLAAGVGGLLLILGVPGAPGSLFMTLGSLGLLIIFLVVIRRQPTLFNITLLLGVVAWVVGNLLWLAGRPIFGLVLWWMGFLVLTIVGERLELSRLMRLSRPALALFGAGVGLFAAGLLLSLVHLSAGTRLAGAALLLLTAWLLRYDIARRTVRASSPRGEGALTRFIGLCLLSGYFWLGVSGVLALVFGGVTGGPRYDAFLHTVFLGFVFAMIFGHAPIIFPAVVRLTIPFRPAFYAHLVLLHLSLALRIAGDLAGWVAGRQWGGMLNGLAILLFLVNTALAVRRSVTTRGAGR